MGSCFSKRKRSDAAVTHNASPRSSFSASCKGDTFAAPSPMRANKPSDEIVVVLTKDSAALLANTQNSVSLKKSKSKNPPCAQQVEDAKLHTKEKGSVVQSKVQSNSVAEDESLPNLCEDEKALLNSHSQVASVDKVLQRKHNHEASTDAVKPPSTADGSEHSTKKCTTPVTESMGNNANESIAHDKEVHPSFDDEFVVETSLAKLKRSRSCEEVLRSSSRETKRPLRRRSFQETSTFSPRTTKLETIPEPQFGTTKYLEGLDLVDVLPYRSSQNEAPSGTLSGVKGNLKPTVLGLPQHESNGLSADFFALKNRYLSSCSAAMHSASVCDVHLQGDDGMMSPCNPCPEEDAAMMGSFDLMHSRASSLDAADHMEMVNLFPSSRHPISAVAEGDEDECGSDDSETFEFKQAVSIYAQQPSEKKAQLRNRVAGGGESEFCRVNERNELCMSKGRKGLGRFKELSVVATGDAVLYTGSNSEEFDLIPSKSYVRGSPNKVSDSCPSVLAFSQSTYNNSLKGLHDDEEKQQQSSLSVEDIIFLLERDELDEEVLLSFLNLARSTTTSHAGNTPSCHTSDVASEASFEFKVKSPGSTPHSTPSTPMLSAGSTPKRMTQLSPLALTPEEIAEIWGVFEQRQALSPFQM